MLSIRTLTLTTIALTLSAGLRAQQTPDEALHALQEGNRRFASERSVPQPVGEGVRRTLARGQSPFAIVVTCADSRVAPEHLFNTGLGELIVVRTAGHVASPETVATVEQAVQELAVPLCIVLGHEHCDVVAAALSEVAHPDHDSRRSLAMLQLLERIEPAIRKARQRELGGDELLRSCEEEHSQETVHEHLRRSELLRRYASVGKFRIVAARYRFDGTVDWLPTRPLPPEREQGHEAPLGSVPVGLPPHVALRMLRAGHRRFLGDSRPQPDLGAKRRETLAHGQQPLAIVLTDSDSRVVPEHVFDAGLGDLYVVRVAGGALNDDALASIEFAVGELGASLLVVVANGRSAALAAAATKPEQQSLTPSMRTLLRQLEPSVAAARKDSRRELVEQAADLQAVRTLQEARSRSALLRGLEQQGRFAMLATSYDVASGDLAWLVEPRTATSKAGHDLAHDAHGDTGHGHEAAADHGGSDPHGAHAAPHGETPAHGSKDAHAGPGTHDAHDEPAHGEAAHGEDSHGSNDHGDAAHDGEGHGGDRHGAHAPGGKHGAHHGDEHGVDDIDLTLAGHDDATDGHATPHGAERDAMSRWTDPVVVVGMLGILSLLAAAVIATKSRG